MPEVLGPMMRTPPARAASSTCCSSLAPSGPVSRKPLARITAPLTPLRPHSSSSAGRVFAGVQISARSIGPGTSSSVAQVGTPRISGTLGLIG